MNFRNPRIRRPGGSMAAALELNPDVMAEILVRLPRDNPADLLHASAVCKSWLGTVTDPAFLRRYRDLHPTPLVVGFLRNPVNRSLARFLPTTAFRPPAATDHRTCHVLDCRHGRALFYDYGSSPSAFVVWDPITGRERRIPDNVYDSCNNHVVLCARAAAGCDHSACNDGPFLMASAGMQCEDLVQADACVYSSETGVRGGPDGIYLESERYSLKEDRPGVLVGTTLYFVCNNGALLRYDVLGTQKLSTIEPPPGKFRGGRTIVITAENGGLGLVTMQRGVLHLWSTDRGAHKDVKWVKMNRINLRKLMPSNFNSPARLIRFSEDINVIFVRSDDCCIFTIELDSLVTKKVCEMDNAEDVFPYVCFYTPAACAGRMLPAIVGPNLDQITAEEGGTRDGQGRGGGISLRMLRHSCGF